MLPPYVASQTGLFAGECVCDESERISGAKDLFGEGAGMYHHRHRRMLLLVEIVKGSLAPAGRT